MNDFRWLALTRRRLHIFESTNSISYSQLTVNIIQQKQHLWKFSTTPTVTLTAVRTHYSSYLICPPHMIQLNTRYYSLTPKQLNTRYYLLTPKQLWCDGNGWKLDHVLSYWPLAVHPRWIWLLMQCARTAVFRRLHFSRCLYHKQIWCISQSVCRWNTSVHCIME